MIPGITICNITSEASLKSNPKDERMSFYSILYLRNCQKKYKFGRYPLRDIFFNFENFYRQAIKFFKI